MTLFILRIILFLHVTNRVLMWLQPRNCWLFIFARKCIEQPTAPMSHQIFDNHFQITFKMCKYIHKIFPYSWATAKILQSDNHSCILYLFEQQLKYPLSNLTTTCFSISCIFFVGYKIFEQQLRCPINQLAITFSSISYIFFVGYFHIFEQQLQRPLSNLTEPRLCVVSCGVCLEHNVLHVAGAVTVRNVNA